MMHIVEDCPVARFPGGLPTLRLAEDGGVVWLDTQVFACVVTLGLSYMT